MALSKIKLWQKLRDLDRKISQIDYRIRIFALNCDKRKRFELDEKRKVVRVSLKAFSAAEFKYSAKTKINN